MTLPERLQQMLVNEDRKEARIKDAIRRREDIDRLSKVDSRCIITHSGSEIDKDEFDALEMELIELEMRLGMG